MPRRRRSRHRGRRARCRRPRGRARRGRPRRRASRRAERVLGGPLGTEGPPAVLDLDVEACGLTGRAQLQPPGGAVAVDEVRHERHQAGAAVVGQPGQHVVGHVAWVVGHRPRGRVAEDHRRLAGVQGRPHRGGRDVGEVDHHPDPVHLPDHLGAERRQPPDGRARRSPSRPTACCRCGSASGSARRARAASAACRASSRSSARPRRRAATRSGPTPRPPRSRRPCRRTPAGRRTARSGSTPRRSAPGSRRPRGRRAARTARRPTRTGRRRRRPSAAAGRCGSGSRRRCRAGRSRSRTCCRASHSRSLWPSMTGWRDSSSATASMAPTMSAGPGTGADRRDQCGTRAAGSTGATLRRGRKNAGTRHTATRMTATRNASA